MPLHSSIDTASAEFARNAEAMRALVVELKGKLNSVAGGGGEASRARHTKRGKMLEMAVFEGSNIPKSVDEPGLCGTFSYTSPDWQP